MKTMTVAGLCQHLDRSVQAVEKALANLQDKGLVTGFVPGNVSAEITLTPEAAKYFS
ncbi:MarR family transcriptional regulator [Paraburkholderia sp. A3RO-2L]|uniref:MarR family transcriptional regulator n=1 Tax=unclassified Paraburkholderia TaxID=2615204 RepID=UPI0033051044|nr:MarR family transcriptional regulator [Burkholderia vietnamiensis]